jgi:predicted permease
LWVASQRGRPVGRDALGAFRHACSVRRFGPHEDPAAGSRIGISSLDVKLGLRMLAKYPGLSSISVLGMAVAIAIGAGAFSIIASLMETALPLPDGDRVVALRNAITTEIGQNRASLRDFMAWQEMKSVQDVAAFATVRRNLVAPGVPVDLVRVVRMTASGFRIARTTPLRGRTLLDEDERTGVHVVVIAYDEWQERFAADPGIIGRRVALDGEEYTIVGVMPEGFHFPIDDRYWIPFAIGPVERGNADAVDVTIVARLTEGTTLESAQAELSAIGTGMAAAYPDTHERLRPRVLHYTRAFFDMDSPEMIWAARLWRVFVSLLLVVVAVNVAILVYARTATRTGEIAVRTALGASRARVVAQLFAEALVLSVSAAIAGLALAGVVLAQVQGIVERRVELPFWVNLGLSPGVIAYALVLAILGAVIVGVAPALKATGRRVHTTLQQHAGRSGRMQLGRAWTALIIAQVAVAVAVLPFAVHMTQEVMAAAVQDAGYPAAEFLEASVTMERAMESQDTSVASQQAMERRFRVSAAELIDRLQRDPAIAGFTVRMPRSYERVDMEHTASSEPDERWIGAGSKGIDRIEPDFFALHGMPIVAGRDFAEGDTRAETTPVIVNQEFAGDYLGGPAVGRRLRFVRESDTGEVEVGPWRDIVGVVRDPASTAYEPADRIYLPVDVAQLSPPINLAIRMRVSPAIGFAPQLREIAAAVDPMLQLDGVIGAAQRHRQGQRASLYFALAIMAAMSSVVLLSAAGIHAMMSFTVARRRREIGIRSALGANPSRLLRSIFARASALMSAGILFGMIGTVALDRMTGKGPVNDSNPLALVVVAALMTTVGMVAAIGPARRGLAVQPTEALREE